MASILIKLKRLPLARDLYHGVKRLSAELFGSSITFGLLNSVLSMPAYFREQFAVARGRRNYYRSINVVGGSHTGLRRNIHRIEKGLIMKPMREVFAVNYIMETVEFYECALESGTGIGSINPGELTWARDVLAEYFSVTDRIHPTIARAREKFLACPPSGTGGGSYKPFSRVAGTRSTFSYDELLRLAHQRRSVRAFLPIPVSRELVDKALLVARQSPTACNRLPYEFRIFDDPQLTSKVAAIPMGARTFAEQIPTIAVVLGKQRHFFSARDRHVIYVDASLAAMGFLYALETLGLASTVINWPDLPRLERRMQQTLQLDWDERVVMLIALGHPDPEAQVPFSEKKPLELLRSWNFLGEP